MPNPEGKRIVILRLLWKGEKTVTCIRWVGRFELILVFGRGALALFSFLVNRKAVQAPGRDLHPCTGQFFVFLRSVDMIPRKGLCPSFVSLYCFYRIT